MIGKKKKSEPAVRRSPQVIRQKQSSFQYSSNRSQPTRARDRSDNPETDEKTTKKAVITQRFSRATLLFVFITGLLAVGFLSVLSAQPKIVAIADEVTVRDTSEYIKEANDLTSGLLSRSKFTINRQKITNQMQDRFPELISVNVSTPLFSNKAVIKVTIAKPELLLRSGSDNFVLDNRGVVVLNTSDDPGVIATEKLLLLTDQSNTRLQVGQPALTSDHVTFISELKHQAEAKQMKIEAVTLAAGGGELSVKYVDVPYAVKYSLGEDARKSFGTFIASKEYIERTNVKPAEYIDVRIAERAYLK